MKSGAWQYLVLFGLVAVLAGSSCRRERVQGPPKAVPVSVDGTLELAVMSFNVRYEGAGDRGARSWRERVIGVVRMIRRERPDCIGVQEALHGQVADLWASLPEYEFFGVGRDDGRRAGEYTGVFYRRDRFQIDQSDAGNFWLSDTPERAGSMTWGNEFPRVAVWLRLRDFATGRSFSLWNTHWDHRNQESRERAALLIAARIDGRSHPDEPVVLIGDFNANENNPALAYLRGSRQKLAGKEVRWDRGLLDSYQVLHAGEKNRRTLHFWGGTLEGALKVDHILVSKGAVVDFAKILSKDQPMVSDHFPVMSRVRFLKR